MSIVQALYLASEQKEIDAVLETIVTWQTNSRLFQEQFPGALGICPMTWEHLSWYAGDR